MLLADHIALIQQTKRLQRASEAIAHGAVSAASPDMTFDFAGVRFMGDDAHHLMNTVLGGVQQIADSAKAALIAGGVEFPADPAPKEAN